MSDRPTPPTSTAPHIVREVVMRPRVSFLDEHGQTMHHEWAPEVVICEAAFTPDMRILLMRLGLTVAAPPVPTTDKGM